MVARKRGFGKGTPRVSASAQRRARKEERIKFIVKSAFESKTAKTAKVAGKRDPRAAKVVIEPGIIVTQAECDRKRIIAMAGLDKLLSKRNVSSRNLTKGISGPITVK